MKNVSEMNNGSLHSIISCFLKIVERCSSALSSKFYALAWMKFQKRRYEEKLLIYCVYCLPESLYNIKPPQHTQYVDCGSKETHCQCQSWRCNIRTLRISAQINHDHVPYLVVSYIYLVYGTVDDRLCC